MTEYLKKISPKSSYPAQIPSIPFHSDNTGFYFLWVCGFDFWENFKTWGVVDENLKVISKSVQKVQKSQVCFFKSYLIRSEDSSYLGIVVGVFKLKLQ